MQTLVSKCISYDQKRVKTGYIGTCIGARKVSAFSKTKGYRLEKVLREVATLYSRKYPKSKIAKLLKDPDVVFKSAC